MLALREMERLVDEQTVEQSASGWMDNGEAGGEEKEAVRITKRIHIDAPKTDDDSAAILLMNRIGKFQRREVLPVIDAYRYSTLLASAPDKNILHGSVRQNEIYVAVAKQLDAAHELVGKDAQLVVSMCRKCYDRLIGSAYADNLGWQGYLRQGKLDLYCNSIGNDLILPVPTNRMRTRYNSFDETGLNPVSNAKQINWLIIPRHAPLGGSQTSIKQSEGDASGTCFDYTKTLIFKTREGAAVFACVSE